MSIEEGNKLIAEFLGWKFEIEPNDFGGELIAYFNGEMKWRGDRPKQLSNYLNSENSFGYHLNWNKLMPVLKNISGLLLNKDWDNLQEALKRWKPIENELRNLSLNNTWFCVVQFINWYNSNK